jgi:vacuolar-type H+-ATPase subunit D/Vma8
MVTVFNECNVKEAVERKLVQLQEEFLLSQERERDEARIEALQKLTDTINKEFRKLKNATSQTQQTEPSGSRSFSNITITNPLRTSEIKPSFKTTIGDKLVPSSLRADFDRTNITTVQKLIDFFASNETEFANIFERGAFKKYEERTNATITTLEDLFDFFESERNSLLLVFPTASSLETFKNQSITGSVPTFEKIYPNLNLRLNSGPISSAEVEGFIIEYRLVPTALEEKIIENPKETASLFNSFLGKLGIGIEIMGSFCSLVDNVFALLQAQRDITNNPANFFSSFQNVLSLINPDAAALASQLQDLKNLIESTQQSTENTIQNLQSAFSTLSSVFGIGMNFFDRQTQTGGSLDVQWDFEAIKGALLTDIKFSTILPQTGKPLGDVNQDGVIDSSDETAFQNYIDNSATAAVNDYINNIMLLYMNQNVATYSEYADFPSASTSSNLSDVFGSLARAVELFGSVNSPDTGTFGLNELSEMLSITNDLSSTISSISGGSLPANITGVIQQLETLVSIGKSVQEVYYQDTNAVLDEFRTSTADTIAEAEELATSDPETAREISESNAQAVEEGYSQAIGESAEVSSNMGATLTGIAGQIRTSVSRLAAVGVLDQLAGQLTDVVAQSASNVRNRLALVTPESISNDYHANMESSYSRMAGLTTAAEEAVSEETTEEIQRSVQGMIAQAAARFREFLKEDVESIVLRFCKLAGEIERVYNEVLVPIETMQANFAEANPALSTAGNENTVGAIRAGAIRYDTATRLRAIQEAGDIFATLASPYVTAGGARSTVPGQGTPQMRQYPPLPADYQFPTYEQALAGARGVLYAPGSSSSKSGRAGFLIEPYGGVNPTAMRLLYELAREWGQTIRIKSAYRSPEANASARGARRSLHMVGQAFDCSIAGRGNQTRFMNLAYQVGFRGFGTYNSFTHIDIGATRSWGNFKYYDLPGQPGYKVG